MADDDMNPAQKALETAILAKGINMASLSRQLGKNASYIQQHVRYGNPPYLPEEVRVPIAKILDISEKKLRKPSFVSFANTNDVARDHVSIDTEGDSDVLSHAWRHANGVLQPGEVMERDVRGGMGIGGKAEELMIDGKPVDKPAASWVFPVSFLHSELRASEHEVDIIAVDGDSMMPTLLPGDRVMVHRAARSPSPDGVFAINDGIGVSVKRLQLVRGSDPLQIRIISDNDRHPTDIVMAADVTVIGRVICKVSRV